MKRLTVQLFRGLALLVFCGSLAVFAAEAPNLTARCVVTPSENAGEIWALNDGNRATSFRAGAGTSLKIAGESPFSGLYILWETPPAPWRLAEDGEETVYGENGFLHEFVALNAPRTEITLTLGEAPVICDMYLFGAGAPPEWVQRWQPPCEDADMLLLPTHADDEHLYFGGALPVYAGEQGKKVQVAYLTNHWAEPYRPHELLDGLWQAGVTAYPVMGPFADRYAESLEQAQALYPEQEVLAWQVALLRRFRPEVVVGHDIAGEYGHGVHIYNTHTLKKALELCGDAQSFPESAVKYGCWDVPKTYLHLYPENPVEMNWNQPLSRFGGKTALEITKESFAKHKSQQTFFAVEDFGPYDCRRFGLYRSTVGSDTNGEDFFEHLEPADYSDYIVPEPEPRIESEQGALVPAPSAEKPAPEARGARLWGPVLLLALLLGALFTGLFLRNRRRKPK